MNDDTHQSAARDLTAALHDYPLAVCYAVQLSGVGAEITIATEGDLERALALVAETTEHLKSVVIGQCTFVTGKGGLQ